MYANLWESPIEMVINNTKLHKIIQIGVCKIETFQFVYHFCEGRDSIISERAL